MVHCTKLKRIILYVKSNGKGVQSNGKGVQREHYKLGNVHSFQNNFNCVTLGHGYV